MSLEKLTIKHEKGRKNVFDGTFTALFNPSQLAYSKSVRWRTETPAASSKTTEHCEPLVFEATDPETLSISLFFDTYEGDSAAGGAGGLLSTLGSLLPSRAGSPRATSVLVRTREVSALARVDPELHRPPVCVLQWGKVSLLKGVLTSLSQQLLLFLEDGTPVRATLDCTFQEQRADSTTTRGELHSADIPKRHTVRVGDTLIRLAAELYGDPSLWRVIARANRIDNPRILAPGRVLLIPPLR